MQTVGLARLLEEKTRDSNFSDKKIFSVFLLVSFVLSFITVSSSFAQTCEETCIVTILDYCTYTEYYPNKSNSSVPIGEWGDSSCGTYSATIGLHPPGTIYQIYTAKYFWNASSWQIISSYQHYAIDSQLNEWISGASYVTNWGTDYTKLRSTTPKSLYPKGCSDLPSQQPDQIPNPDTGKPECSNQML